MESSRDIFTYIRIPSTLEEIIFHMTDENIESSVQKTMNLFDANFPYSFNIVICMLVHTAFSSRSGEGNMYITYLRTLQNKEEEANINNPKIIDIFGQYLLRNQTQESYYLLEKMVQQNLFNSNITKNIQRNILHTTKQLKKAKKGLMIHFVMDFLETLTNYQRIIGSSTSDWFKKELIHQI